MSDFKKQPTGEYRIFGKNDGAMAMCVIPAWVTAASLLSVAQDMVPPSKPKRAPKRKPDVVENGGE